MRLFFDGSAKRGGLKGGMGFEMLARYHQQRSAAGQGAVCMQSLEDRRVTEAKKVQRAAT